MKVAMPRRHLKRGAYLIPSLLTTGNLFLGFYALIKAVHGYRLGMAGGAPYFDTAALAIGWAVLFDGWDGRVARMMGATSDFGRELDSLADCIAFGLAPAFLAYAWGIAPVDVSSSPVFHEHLQRVGLFVCFLFLVCGACRLARFNIQTNPVPANPGRPGRKYFVGLAIPAGAGVVASIVHFQKGQFPQWIGWPVIWLAIVLATALLMVSTWRYPSLKDIPFGRVNILLIVTIFGLIYLYSEYVLLLIAGIYTGTGIVFRITALFRRRKSQPLVENV